MDAETEKRLRYAIRTMPGVARAAFALHRFDDLPYGEIAEHLGIEVREVEARLVRAICHLDRCMHRPVPGLFGRSIAILWSLRL